MREILFRGKRVENGEWVEGYLFKIWDKTYILLGTTNDVPNMIEVIPETVGQYTGLTTNGKKIFEGDIANCITSDFDGSDKYIYNFKITDITDYEQMGFLDFCHEIKIIGNIHDNPELMKGGD